MTPPSHRTGDPLVLPMTSALTVAAIRAAGAWRARRRRATTSALTAAAIRGSRS
ncbi:MAG TPA: hypothetical protein VNY52_11305 [Solirubrobacteraceae bacterium]|nr:hypothetical protein [Solirubrobacteraceae bacterium]